MVTQIKDGKMAKLNQFKVICKVMETDIAVKCQIIGKK
jgi:hypothetical protein